MQRTKVRCLQIHTSQIALKSIYFNFSSFHCLNRENCFEQRKLLKNVDAPICQSDEIHIAVKAFL